MQDFIHLHVHTHYSILDGMSKVNRLVDKAIQDGMKGMAITDHGNMFAIKELFDYTNEVNGKRAKEGLPAFKPIFGCEMYVARRSKADQKEKEDRGGYHLIVLAKNLQGYHNLVKLVSRSWVDGFYGRPRTDREDLKLFHEGLIVCSACIGGEVPKRILEGDMAGAREAVEWYRSVWGEDYYLELQRHEVKNPEQRANRETYPLQVKANEALIGLAKEYGIKLICTNDCHFVDEQDAEAHDHLLCLSTSKTLDDPTRMLYTKQEWFKTQAEMNDIFSDVPEALSNTLEILDKVETYDLNHSPIMPFFPIPESFGTEEEWRTKFTEEDLYREFCSDENGENLMEEEAAQKRIKNLGGYNKIYRIKFEADYLGKLAYEGAKRLYGDPTPQEVLERIKFELHVMKTMGFPGYFLIVQDFINSARNELDVWVGPGRGSAAGSVVAYCLGITRLDPIKYDLLFERFLNPDRVSLPDIDTDFDDDGRGRVLQWVMDKYGHENCAHIITYGTMAAKNSLKDVARVERLPLDRSNALTKAIPDRLPEGMKMNLANAIKCTPELQEAESSADEKERNTINYARSLEGTVRGTGIHACGFIICRDAISDHVPVSTAEDPDFKGVKVPVTQYDGHVIESTGLIKMDFLGLKTLSEMREAVKNIKQTRGIDVDVNTIPIDDPLTYKLYQEGRTIGTFQFESPGMQKYLRELHPEVFGDLIAMNALYRPGPMDNIPSFINRKLGKEEIVYKIPEMEKYLKDTYGITVYQEQVMLLSRLLAGFTRGQSDSLRKAMGKKKIKEMEKLEVLFYEGGEKRGHNRETLKEIWEEWKKFASYAFNKSHAACYSWVAFQTAYLKAHYPAEYLAALLTRRKNDIKDVTKLMDECKQMNIATLIPNVNESYSDFGVNQKGEIRFGLAGIKGVGEAPAFTVVEERQKNGPFKDYYDFVERINLSACNRKAIESMILAGAFDDFGLARENYFEKDAHGTPFLDLLIRYGQEYQSDKAKNTTTLFDGMDDFQMVTRPAVPALKDEWSDMERLDKERELIGIYLSAHPLDEYYVILRHLCTLPCVELATLEKYKSQAVSLGGIVTSVRERFTKRNVPFGIVKIEDYTGSGEITIFGKTWTEFKNYFVEGKALYITGAVNEGQWNKDKIELQIGNIDYMGSVKNKLIQRLTICFPSEVLKDYSFSNDILPLLTAGAGETELYMKVYDYHYHSALNMRSKKKINVSRQLLEYLDDASGVKYQIN